jgi:hypothetical protein
VAASTEEHSLMSVSISDSAKRLAELTNLQVTRIEENMDELITLKSEVAGLNQELDKFQS